MSQENVEIVVELIERGNARDFTAVLDVYAEDVTLVLHGVWGSPPEEIRGKVAVAEWFGDWFNQFGPDYRVDIAEVRDAGDRVFVVTRHHAHGRQSGATVEQRMSYVFALSDGEVSRFEMWGEADRDAALEAAGLRE